MFVIHYPLGLRMSVVFGSRCVMISPPVLYIICCGINHGLIWLSAHNCVIDVWSFWRNYRYSGLESIFLICLIIIFKKAFKRSASLYCVVMTPSIHIWVRWRWNILHTMVRYTSLVRRLLLLLLVMMWAIGKITSTTCNDSTAVYFIVGISIRVGIKQFFSRCNSPRSMLSTWFISIFWMYELTGWLWNTTIWIISYVWIFLFVWDSI